MGLIRYKATAPGKEPVFFEVQSNLTGWTEGMHKVAKEWGVSLKSPLPEGMRITKAESAPGPDEGIKGTGSAGPKGDLRSR
jgi:hypothetical protein